MLSKKKEKKKAKEKVKETEKVEAQAVEELERIPLTCEVDRETGTVYCNVTKEEYHQIHRADRIIDKLVFRLKEVRVELPKSKEQTDLKESEHGEEAEAKETAEEEGKAAELKGSKAEE